MEKLEEMRETLSSRLADPSVYDAQNRDKLELWQGKFAEVESALEKAEALWLEAVERLELAEAG